MCPALHTTDTGSGAFADQVRAKRDHQRASSRPCECQCQTFFESCRCFADQSQPARELRRHRSRVRATAAAALSIAVVLVAQPRTGVRFSAPVDKLGGQSDESVRSDCVDGHRECFRSDGTRSTRGRAVTRVDRVAKRRDDVGRRDEDPAWGVGSTGICRARWSRTHMRFARIVRREPTTVRGSPCFRISIGVGHLTNRLASARAQRAMRMALTFAGRSISSCDRRDAWAPYVVHSQAVRLTPGALIDDHFRGAWLQPAGRSRGHTRTLGLSVEEARAATRCG